MHGSSIRGWHSQAAGWRAAGGGPWQRAGCWRCQPPAAAIAPAEAKLPHCNDAGPHSVVEGERRHCLASHNVVCASFPHLTGSGDGSRGSLSLMRLVPGAPAGQDDGSTVQGAPLRLGVLFSGGQASGGLGRTECPEWCACSTSVKSSRWHSSRSHLVPDFDRFRSSQSTGNLDGKYFSAPK